MKFSIFVFFITMMASRTLQAQTPPPPPAPAPDPAAPAPAESAAPPPSNGAIAAPPAAEDVRFQVSGQEIQALRQGTVIATLMLPAAPVRWEVRGRWLMAACRMEGLVVVDVSDPLNMKQVSAIEKGKEIIDFRFENNLLAITTAAYDVQAYRVDLTADRPVPMGEVLSDDAWMAKVFKRREAGQLAGRVVHVSRGFATFRIQEGVPVGVGDFVEIRSGQKDEIYSPLTMRGEIRTSLALQCVARVVQAEKGLAAVQLGRGDDPKVGDLVFFSDRAITGSNRLPQRYRDQWRAFAEVIPLVGSGDSDDTAFLSAVLRTGLHYHADRPFAVQLGMDPVLILGTSKFDDTMGANIFAVFSYETRSFEIGAGFGYQLPLLRGESSHNRRGGVFLQRVRLGALDGLNLIFQFQSVYSNDNKEKKRRAMVGMIHAEANIPLMRQVTLFTRYFGDGRTFNHGGIGLRTYLRGSGGPGSFLVPVTLGYTSFSPYRNPPEADVNDQYEVSGTTLSAGLEYRF